MARKDYAAEKGNELTFTITAWQQQVGLKCTPFNSTYSLKINVC